MDKFNLPISEHNRIRTSPEVCAELNRLASQFAADANAIADTNSGYKTNLRIGTDRARAHVWASTKKARRVEAKTAPLMQLVARAGIANMVRPK